MYKYIYPLIKCKIKPWLKYYIVKKGEGTPSEIITTASPITLVNSLRRKFIKFIVGGNSIQNGEPTPATPVEIQNVTGNVEVKVENKNKFDGELELGQYDSNTGQKLSNNNLYRNKNIIKVKPLTTYTFSINGVSQAYVLLEYKSNKEYIGQTVLDSGTFTTNSNTGFINFRCKSNDFTSDYANLKVQLEIGSTATDYVPHEQQTAIFPLSEGQVLHEEDTIEDKIVQRRKTLVLDGTEEWVLTNAEVGQFRLAINDMTKNPILSNYFGYKLSYSASGKPYLRPANGSLFAEIGTEFLPEVSVVAWKNWLAEKYANGTPVTLEYELETPIETEFTEAQRTAKAQIDKLYSYKGTTHISSTNDPSPIFEVQYYMEGE